MDHSYPIQNLTSKFQCLVRWALCALCAIAYLTVTNGVNAADVGAKRVLIISTGSRLAPGFVIVDQQLLRVLGNIPSVRTEIYAENLDLVRFPSERYRQIFREYLADKYAAHHPDLVILVFVGTLGIPGKLLSELFPGTPIVVAGFTEEEIRTDQFGTLVSGVAQRVNPRATLELILRLQPELRRIVVIGGTAEIDRQVLQRVKEAAQSIKGHIQIDFWDNLTMAELRKAVIAMPQDTAILYARMFRDAAGQAVISSEVGQWIAQSANVPVYVMTDASFGTGAVGGSLASIEAFGKRAGELARLILTGTGPASLPFEIRTESVPTFDWRALKRWGISEDRLPPKSIVRFRPQSIWEQYRWYIIAALIIICLQSVMIIDLLLQHRRRARVQAELQESKELMELATNAGELGLWSRELTGGDVWVNEPMRSLFGFGAHDTVRFEDILSRVHSADRDHMLSEVEHTQTAGLRFEGEFRILPANGTERWVVAKGRTVVESNGHEGRRRMGVVLDITERKRAQDELRRNREELAYMTRITTMGELAASLAHELNQPLTAILSNAQAAQRFLSGKPSDIEEVREILHDIVEDNTRAGEVIRRMRALVKKEEFEFSSLDLSEIIREIVLLVHSDAVLHNVSVRLDVDPDLPRARGDKVQLQQVLLNLLLNAFDAMRDCPADERDVLLRAELDGADMLRISVSDHGTGLTSDQLDKIFQPFFTTKREGLGMGLSISRSIVEAHDGRIWAENNRDQGATFYFMLPVMKI